MGCAVKEKVKLSEDAVMVRNAISTVDAIKDAYAKKSRIIIQEKVESGLSDEILKGLTFETADLSLTIRMVRISANNIMVHLNWQGTWIAGGNEVRDRGIGIMVFKKDTMKLSQVDGGNPFQMPLVR